VSGETLWIFLSPDSRAPEEAQRRLQLAGCDHHWMKPATRRELHAVVASFQFIASEGCRHSSAHPTLGTSMEPTASGSPTTTLHHAPGPVSWFLVVDHVRLDALLQRAGAQPGAIDHATYAEFRAGLLTQIGMEEKILLPAA
jgi:hypothetical protein